MLLELELHLDRIRMLRRILTDREPVRLALVGHTPIPVVGVAHRHVPEIRVDLRKPSCTACVARKALPPTGRSEPVLSEICGP
jgi:hypothetical protein